MHWDYFGLTRDQVLLGQAVPGKFYHARRAGPFLVQNREAVYASGLRGGRSSFLRGYLSLIGKPYDEVARHYVSNHRGYTALFMRNRIVIETISGYRGSWGGLLCVFDGDRLSVVKQLGRGAYGDLITYDSGLAASAGSSPAHNHGVERASEP